MRSGGAWALLGLSLLERCVFFPLNCRAHYKRPPAHDDLIVGRQQGQCPPTRNLVKLAKACSED